MTTETRILPIAKIISGGQTGADRAGLDVGLELGIPIGGHCPRGRRAEDGRIPDIYPLIETESRGYPDRTNRNIVNSDCTLIFSKGRLGGGSLMTYDLCRTHKKRGMVIFVTNESPQDHKKIESIKLFLEHYNPKVINIAGNRESRSPGIYQITHDILLAVLSP